MTVDFDVKWGVSEDHRGPSSSHQSLVGGFLQRITAEDPVLPKMPEVSWLGGRRARFVDWQFIAQVRRMRRFLKD
jgi:hypothetical protein